MTDSLNPDRLAEYLVAVLFLALILSLFRIRNLKVLLEDERRKRILPLLIMKLDNLEEGLHLLNDSYCHACGIRIKDFNVTVDYGFKKQLRLSFPPIDMLKAQGKIPLTFRVFDGEHEVTRSDTILAHMLTDTFDVRLRYRNLENAEFISLISRDKKKFVIKEAGPADKILKKLKKQKTDKTFYFSCL